MNVKHLVAKLNWFYNLELNQVDLYNSQSKKFKGGYASEVFERVSYIEQQHVDNIAVKIKELGGKPSNLGDVIAPFIGSVGGTLVSMTGLQYTLKINIALEQKAKKDYNNLINHIKSQPNSEELMLILKSNYVDEDLHSAWFTQYLTKI